MASSKNSKATRGCIKKTRQGMGKNTKWGNKGGGNGGSTPSKKYKKKYRGQGK
jgi:hypothetical protein